MKTAYSLLVLLFLSALLGCSGGGSVGEGDTPEADSANTEMTEEEVANEPGT